MSRSQLIEIIYQLQLRQDELTADNERLSKELADKRLRISQAGNIAQAALNIHNVMESAQAAAQVYLEEIRLMREETEAECRRLLASARQEAKTIAARSGSSRKKKRKKRK